MKTYQMGEMEQKFADIVWKTAPTRASTIVQTACEQFGWAKTTAYTVLKRLCEKGLFKNNNSTISVIVTKEEYLSARSRIIVKESFDGSLPAFIAAFMGGKKLSPAEADRLHKMVDEYEE